MKKKPFIWVLNRIRGRIPVLLLLTAAQVGNGLLGVLFALGSREVIDSAVSGNHNHFRLACVKQCAIICGILLTLVLVRHLRDKLHAQLERDWKQSLLRGLLQGSYRDISVYHSGELINRLNNDVNRVNEGILSIIPNALAMATRLFGAVVVMGLLDLRFTALIAAFGLLVLLAAGLMRSKLKELNKRVSEHDGRISSFLQEILEKLLIVQAMDLSEEVENRADKLLDERYEVHRRRKNASLAANSGIQMLSYGAWFLALYWCGNGLMTGRMSFGAMMAVMQLVGQLQTPLVGLSGILPQYAAMIASAERLMELDRIHPEPEDKQDTKAVYERMESICGENVTFCYDREPVLQDTSFEIQKDTFAVITGSSGIGKSTILKLLLGIYPLEFGKLYLKTSDGNIALNRGTRGIFAYVPQGNLIFSGSIRENLTIGHPDATEAEIKMALYSGCFDEVLEEIPGGLDAQIGENGAGLSEGQAQRLAISRAVLGGAPVLLLDECTSALDEETEKKVLDRIRNLPGRTCIAVTHRDAAKRISDVQIMVKNKETYTIKSH